MTTRSQLVSSVLSWEGTPYHHHARVKGAGVDCVQLIAAVALDVGYINQQQAALIPLYPTQWNLHEQEERLLNNLEFFGLEQIPNDQVLPGDILTFKFGRATSHVGVLINENEFIHAAINAGKVVINTLNEEWKKRWTHTFRLPGVLDG